MRETTPAVNSTVTSIAKGIVSRFNEELSKSKFITIGAGIGKAIAEGIASSAEEAKVRATEVAHAIAEALKTALTELLNKEEYFAIGKGVGDAVAEGMLASIPAVKAAAAKIAEAAKVNTKGGGNNGGVKALSDAVDSIGNSIGNMGALVNASATRENGRVSATSNEVVNNYNFVQNNTSPKALSRLDIYRDTRNMLRSL
jgi:DNA-binding transcriptional regulator YhcF (GntR family)